MKGNFKNSYMNDAEIENVSGGEMNTTKKVIAGIAAIAGLAILTYGSGVAYETIKHKTPFKDALKHPFGLLYGKKKEEEGGQQ